MDELLLSCDNASEFPKNLVQPCVHEFAQDALLARLNSLESRLFHPDRKALVDFLEFADAGSGEFSVSSTYRES